jgi:hypothetical protein
MQAIFFTTKGSSSVALSGDCRRRRAFGAQRFAEAIIPAWKGFSLGGPLITATNVPSFEGIANIYDRLGNAHCLKVQVAALAISTTI